jgi:hypothetical protein
LYKNVFFSGGSIMAGISLCYIKAMLQFNKTSIAKRNFYQGLIHTNHREQNKKYMKLMYTGRTSLFIRIRVSFLKTKDLNDYQ